MQKRLRAGTLALFLMATMVGYGCRDGNKVETQASCKVTRTEGISAVVDILRIRDEKLVEHWDIVQAVPPDSEMPHGNGMF